MSEGQRKKLENSGTWFKKGHPSPNKGKKLSEETKKKISKTLRGVFGGNKHPMWGKKHSEESIQTMIKSHENISDETKRKISKSNKGKPAPNKGIPASEESKKKMSESHKGNTPWNKGRTGIYSEETIMQMSKSHKNMSEETKRKISKSNIGKLAWNKGQTGVYSEETLDKIRASRRKQIFPSKDTKPERFLQSALSVNGIKFKKHIQEIVGYPDLFVEPNICIFVDGNYWHGHPSMSEDKKIVREITVKQVRERDSKINHELIEQGYHVCRFWEDEIYNDAYKCVIQIKEIISNLTHSSS